MQNDKNTDLIAGLIEKKDCPQTNLVDPNNHRPVKQNFFKGHIFKRTLKTVLIFVITASLLLNLFTFIMPVVKYYGDSMSPTLNDGQILIVNKMIDVVLHR